ncbi:hypothetical protein BBJ28_00024297 [Nothophytophthora sp. Chile5]|nr:hypothetical protein BBJ28_00024297 [Nothophytophthora sp. Chile5]
MLRGSSSRLAEGINQPPLPEDQASAEKTAADNTEKAKKKRRRSKKDKNKPPPPKLVRAKTTLNELKNVKPLLQQRPEARLHRFEQIKDAYALDEGAKPLSIPGAAEARPRFFSIDNWRKAPETLSSQNSTHTVGSTVSPPPLQRSQVHMRCGRPGFCKCFLLILSLVLCVSWQTAVVSWHRPTNGANNSMLSTSRRHPSSNATEEVSVNEDDPGSSRAKNLDDAGQATAAIAGRVVSTERSNEQHGKTSERRTPQRSERSSLRLDDVDESLMNDILGTGGGH